MDFSLRSCKLSWQFSTCSLRPPQTILSLFRNLSKIPDGLASGSGQNLQDVIGGLFKDPLNGAYFGLSLIFGTILVFFDLKSIKRSKSSSGDDLEKVQSIYIIGHEQAKNITIEEKDIKHETKARFGKNILILDFNFDISLLTECPFRLFLRFPTVFPHLFLPRHSFYHHLFTSLESYLKKVLFSNVFSFSILWEAQL